ELGRDGALTATPFATLFVKRSQNPRCMMRWFRRTAATGCSAMFLRAKYLPVDSARTPTEAAAYLGWRGRFPGCTRKYLSTKPPRRPWSGPPQLRHVIWCGGATGAWTLIIL